MTEKAVSQKSGRGYWSRVFDRDKILLSIPVQIMLCIGISLVLAVLVLGTSFIGNAKIQFLLVALFPGLIVLRVIRNLEKLLLGIIVFNAVFPIDINFFQRIEIQDMSGILGFNISLTTLILFVLYVLWMVRKEDDAPPVPGRLLLGAILPTLFFLVTIILSFTVATDRQATTFEIWLVFQILIQHVYFVYNVRTKDKIQFIMTVLMLVVLAQALLMIYLYVSETNYKIGPIETYGADDGMRYRVGGTLGHANSAGGFLGLMLLPAFGVIFSQVDTRLRILAIATFVFGFIALITTFSRGSWSGVTSFTLLFIMVGLARSWIRLPNIILMLFPASLTVASFWDTIFGRLTQSDTSAFDDRLPLNDIAIAMIRDYPILGIGANNYWLVMRGYAAQMGGIWPRVVHNKYLLVTAETGIVGLVAFIFVLLTVLAQGWRYVIRDAPLSPLALGLLCGLMSNMLHMNVDIFNGLPQLQMLWLVISLLYGMNLMESVPHDQSNQ